MSLPEVSINISSQSQSSALHVCGGPLFLWTSVLYNNTYFKQFDLSHMVVVSSEKNLRPRSAGGLHINDKEDCDVLTSILEGCLESLPCLSTQPPGLSVTPGQG